MSVLRYSVRWTVVVDHPEKRNASFRPSEPHKLHHQKDFETQNAAIAFYDSLVRGEEDFGSEYPTAIRALQIFEFRSPRVVRKLVGRERMGDGSVRLSDPTRPIFLT
jgi:hypothetical protein